MEMVEVLPVYPGIELTADAVPREEGWSLRLFPAKRPAYRSKEFLWAAITGFILALSYLRPWYLKAPGGNLRLCWFRSITGLPCLLCGMTRSLAAAARLNVGESFYLHLLGPFLFLFLILAFLGSFSLLITGQRMELSMPGGARRQLYLFLLVLLVAAWVLKITAFGVNV